MTQPDHAPGLIIRIPPPIWLLALLVIAFGLDQVFDWGAMITLRARAIAIPLFVVGVGLVLWGRTIFAKVGTEIMPSSPANAKLVIDGPFKYSRNPMYLGGMLFSLGVALYVGTLPYYLMAGALFLLLSRHFIPFEEAKMERQYGQDFRDYTARVRRWI